MTLLKLQQQAAALIYLAISTCILALVLRTWLVMGLIAPATVSGSSMAPNLVGPHVAVSCPKCQLAVRVGAHSLPTTNHALCPYCRQGQLDWTRAYGYPGSRLWIDRSTTLWRLPHRWEVVVFHTPWQWQEHKPEHADALCLKRVLGLPGEQVRLAAGDLLINGQLQVKTLPEQRLLRQLVRRRSIPVLLPANDSMTEKQVLFHADHPLTDDVPYNGQLSRQLRLVHDFMLSARLACHGRGQLEWTVDDGRQPLGVLIDLAEKTVQVAARGKALSGQAADRLLGMQTLSEFSRQRLAGGEVILELSTFDRQLLLAIDGRVELRYALRRGVPPAGTVAPFAVASSNLAVQLREITLWRDVYYGPLPVGFGSWGKSGTKNDDTADREATWHLSANQLFLVGDNAPVSIDSRVWPGAGISRHRLVGRLIGGQ